MSLFNNDEKALLLYPRLAVALKGVIDEKSVVNGAMVLAQIHYWCEKNAENDVNYRDGRYWAFSTYVEWIERDFPFWSKNTLIRIIEKLEDANLLLSSSKYNKKKYDKTKWYAINYDELEKVMVVFHQAEFAKAEIAASIEEEVEKATTQDGYTVNENEVKMDEKTKSDYPRWVDPLPKMGSTTTQDGYKEEPKMGRPIQDINKQIKNKIKNNTFGQKPKKAEIALVENEQPKTFSREDSKALRDLIATQPRISYSPPPMEASASFWEKR